MSFSARDGDVGFLTFVADDYVKWSSLVFTDVQVTAAFLDEVAEINSGLPVGTLIVRPSGQVLWSFKLLPQWIDVESRTSAQMIVSISTNAPTFVRMSRDRLAPFGGSWHVPDDLGSLMFLS